MIRLEFALSLLVWNTNQRAGLHHPAGSEAVRAVICLAVSSVRFGSRSDVERFASGLIEQQPTCWNQADGSESCRKRKLLLIC